MPPMSDSNALRVKKRMQGNAAYLKLTGTIDESFQPGLVFSDLPSSVLFIDLSGVQRLSSFGVREWTGAMRDVCQKVENVYWVRCSPAMVVQLNFVANFSAKARILSIQSPYYCDSCGHETELTCDLENPADFSAPSVTCDNCGAQMELDEDPNSYFSEPLKNAQSQPINPNLGAILADLIDEDQLEGSIPSVGSAPRSFHTGTSDLPIPSIASRPATTTSSLSMRRAARQNTFNTKLKAIGAGLAIPIVTGLVLFFALPSSDLSDALPDSVRLEFQQSIEARDFAKSASLLRRLRKSSSAPTEVLDGLEGQVAELAMADFQNHIDAGRFSEAGRLVMEAARNRILSRREAERYQRQIVGTVLARHRDLLVKERFEDEATLVSDLFQSGVLPAGIRTQFERDVSSDRNDAAKKKAEQLEGFYRTKKWKDALSTAAIIQRLTQPDAQTRFIMAESHRALGQTEEATLYYRQFISMVGSDTPPHEGLDTALLFIAERLVKAGQKKDARGMLKRLLSMPNSRLKSDAEALLAEIGAGKSPRPSRRRP